ncbi:hypothetical protein IE53DRAFT_386259 [Violaceomyces palustris]|uniref:Uncharacterized protein n=1 Tax=Violaceomyces palustris TaxID=1673888 RepID=A0ACD0NZW4_9BASI|nr:hypothetical protein IE53DRAFT_386259 [Violaceomyces palustris]
MAPNQSLKKSLRSRKLRVWYARLRRTLSLLQQQLVGKKREGGKVEERPGFKILGGVLAEEEAFGLAGGWWGSGILAISLAPMGPFQSLLLRGGDNW